MPVELDARIDIEDVVKGFDELSRDGRDLRRVWRELKPTLRADLREHFRSREGPDGGWSPLAGGTIAARRRATNRSGRKRSSQALLGKLRQAFSIEFDAKELRAVSKVPWSGIHQDGGTAGQGAQIPKRTHIYVSQEFLDRAVERILEHITRRF